MKKIVFLIFCLILAMFVSAQTQHGYVKTKGRMVNGQLVPGQGLKGATISVHGRNTVLVNSDDGEFSFPVSDNTFRLDSVRKKGYQLVDMDACPKTYIFSGNPIYIVMETPEQQQADRTEALVAAKKIRRELEAQLRDKEDELDELREQQKITLVEYQNALNKLEEDRKYNNRLVEDIVDRYSKIDYDLLSETDRLISTYILNGDLAKADSLLRSKGDINARISKLRQHEDINKTEQEELAKRQEQLLQSQALVIKERDDLANDCYRKYEIFRIQRVYDSAAYFIALRAELDTMNPQWQYDAADYYMTPRENLRMYYTRAYNIYKSLAVENPEKYNIKLATTMNYLSETYGKSEPQRIELKEEALEICRNYDKTYSHKAENDMVWMRIVKNIINDYSKYNRDDDIYNLIPEIEMLVNRLNNMDYIMELIIDDDISLLQQLATDTYDLYLVIAEAQAKNQDYEAAENTINVMFNCLKTINGLEKFKLTMSIRSYVCLAGIYYNTGRLDECEAAYNKAMNLISQLSEEAPFAYELYLSNTAYHQGLFYFNTERYDECEQCFNISLASTDRLVKMGRSPDNGMVAHIKCLLGFIAVNREQYDEALVLWQESAAMYKEIYVYNKFVGAPYMTTLQFLGLLYSTKNDYHSCYLVYEDLLPLQKEYYEKDKESIASQYVTTLTGQSYYAIFEKEFAKAVQYADEALKVNPDEHMPVTNKAAALLFMGEYSKAEKLYKKYKKEYKDSFLEDFNAFEDAGVIPADRKNDVEKIRKMLEK